MGKLEITSPQKTNQAGIVQAKPQNKSMFNDGVTYQDIQNRGTVIQKKAFLLFDRDRNRKLEGREFVLFNNSSFTLVGDDLTINTPRPATKMMPAWVEKSTYKNISKLQKFDNLLRQYNINLNFDLRNLESFQIVNKNGKKNLLINSLEFSLLIPLEQQNTKTMYVKICDGEPNFVNLGKGCVVNIKNTPCTYAPGFYNCECQVNCEDGNEYGYRIFTLHSSLTINSNNTKNTVNGENLQKGRTLIENKTPADWEKCKKDLKEDFNIVIK